jgi:acylpyruvate hydrolase
MKLVTFSDQGESRLGALVERDGREWVMDLHRADSRLPSEMIAFLTRSDSMQLAHHALIELPEAALIAREDVVLGAPVPRPGKIICIGHNYHAHTGAMPPAYPDVFAKFNNVVLAPFQPIIIPRLAENVDYEGELAVIIGKRARYVTQDRALECVAGYSIFNDVSARDIVKRQSQWTLGKTFDTFGPFGPALVTQDEVGHIGELELTTTVNGEVRQQDNTRNLIFSIPFLVAYLSEVMTLEPGDVISTGTPSGSGSSLKPQKWLRPGDVVKISIDRIGVLETPIALEP